ncbi:acyl-CoA dehydrogenase family protein [Candidimonas nitroreducens]|uniref:Acyl-CoA dehydrogenase n=1 Tax=Candidimonas nitroreducens TaxID=683354 RepID=A0A225N2Q4_9BURK|nr:acyl-CoA dehydrogenase family protein [Candidimonas nitroreducens]OWT66380.1 acyl-CoA dehydrogenase [Candidimonas nitroreducens]
MFFAQIDQLLSSRELELVHRTREFCDGAFSLELQRSFIKGAPFSADWIAQWAELGMLGLQVPRELGGQGATFACKVRIAQELALHGFGAAFALNNLQGSVTRLARHGTGEQRSRLLEKMLKGRILGAPVMTEPTGGSDLGALRTTATKVDGGWLLDGSKAWITNGTLINCPLVLARVGEQPGAAGIASFLVPIATDATTVERIAINAPGARSFRSAALHFRGHFVPDWCLFNAAGEAFKFSLASINAARVHVAAMCVATLYASLCEAVQYCGERVAFGKNLLAHQGLRWELAEVSTRLEAASALVAHAVALAQNSGLTPGLAAQAKKFAIDTAVWGIEQCIRATGAVGATHELRLAMHYEEVRLAAFADGTNEILQDRIGRGLQAAYTPEAIQPKEVLP